MGTETARTKATPHTPQRPPTPQHTHKNNHNSTAHLDLLHEIPRLLPAWWKAHRLRKWQLQLQGQLLLRSELDPCCNALDLSMQQKASMQADVKCCNVF